MPQITLNFSIENGFRALAAFDAHHLSPLIDPGTSQPYTDLQRLKQGLISLVVREVHASEQGQARQIAYAALIEAEESIDKDPDIVS